VHALNRPTDQAFSPYRVRFLRDHDLLTLGDHHPKEGPSRRRRTCSRSAIALLLPFVGQAWLIYVLVSVVQSASATFTPAFQSLIP